MRSHILSTNIKTFRIFLVLANYNLIFARTRVHTKNGAYNEKFAVAHVRIVDIMVFINKLNFCTPRRRIQRNNINRKLDGLYEMAPMRISVPHLIVPIYIYLWKFYRTRILLFAFYKIDTHAI